MNRTEFPAVERARRSRVAQLSHQTRLMRGTLTIRSRRCGKPGCHCARGEPHVSLYLVQSQKASRVSSTCRRSGKTVCAAQ